MKKAVVKIIFYIVFVVACVWIGAIVTKWIWSLDISEWLKIFLISQ